MGRLIEESSVIEVAEKFTFTDENERRKCLDFVRYCVKNSKTAYDIEKVVAELENAYPINPYPNDFSNGRDMAIRKAISIVKAGGVE